LHQARLSLPAAGGKAMLAAENPDILRIFGKFPRKYGARRKKTL